MRTFAKVTGTLLLCAASAAAFAITRPTEFVSGMVHNLQNQIAAKHYTLKTNPDKLYELVTKEVMPDVAVTQMAGMTLGPKWRSATQTQRDEFVTQFSKLLTRNYSAALLKVQDYDFKIFPLRGKTWEKETQVSVRGAIMPKSGGQGSSVTYYLERAGDSWKVYDFSVEGVSFVNNFRSQFASYANIGDLIDALKKLNERNS